MKLFKHSIKARIFWLLASCVALLLSTPVPGFQAQKNRDENISVTRWEHSDTEIGLKRRLEMRGKAEFTDDYTDIKDVSAGGWVIIEEHRDRESFRYEVRRDPAGQLTRAFYVNGAARPLDESAKTWLAKFVLDAVRQGAIDAEKRVRTLLSQRGVPGVLAEIEQINGDYARRIYYQHLLKQADLDSGALRDALRQMARDIKSDYEQAQLLTTVAPMLAGKDAVIQPFFDAVATIKSDYERSRVIKSVVKDTPNSALLVLAASATKSISSDYERRGVLTALARTKSQSEEVLRLVLDSATEMSSDYEKATFLVEVSNAYTGDTRLKSAFLKAVESIKSDYERGRVLSALLKNKQIG
jgi:hypothetical protein